MVSISALFGEAAGEFWQMVGGCKKTPLVGTFHLGGEIAASKLHFFSQIFLKNLQSRCFLKRNWEWGKCGKKTSRV